MNKIITDNVVDMIKHKHEYITKLHGTHKKYYNQYIKMIHRDLDSIPSLKHTSKIEKEEMIKNLNDELLIVECVFRWLQDKNIELIKKNRSDKK
jgi:hypothetical protein